MQPRSFETRSLAEASAIMAREWSRHEIVASEPAIRMRFQTRAITPDVSLGRLAYGTQVTIRPVERDGVVLVQIPLAGAARASFGALSVPIGPTSYAVLDVRCMSDAVFSAEFDMIVLRIRTSRLLSYLEAALGRRAGRHLAFAPGLEAGSAAWRTWRPVACALEAMCADPGATPAGVLGTWEATIVSALLHAQPNSYTDDLGRPASSIAPRHVRRAEEFIEERAHARLTSEEVARHVGVSIRALFDGFKAFRGLTPAEHIRAVRLVRAREDLLSGRCTVAESASRWGFQHAGHFAKRYRQRFGELPHRTRADGA